MDSEIAVRNEIYIYCIYNIYILYIQYMYNICISIPLFMFFSVEGKSKSGVVEFAAVGVLLIGGNQNACWCSQVDHEEY